MRKEKVRIQGNGIVTCISQWEALKRIKNLDESTWVSRSLPGKNMRANEEKITCHACKKLIPKAAAIHPEG